MAFALGQIRSAVEGPLKVIERPRRRSADAVDAGLCEIWGEVESGIHQVPERTSLEGICRRVDAARRVSDFSI